MMRDHLLITPGEIRLNQLEQIYRQKCKIELDPRCKQAVDRSAEIVAQAANNDLPVYGINTGFGKLASTRIDRDQTAQLQRNLILSHCCGLGEPLANEIVRLIITLKLVSLGRGASGVRWQTIQLLTGLLNHDIMPIIPAKGSVGASGDLAPLAHLTAALIGEGRVRMNGELLSAKQAFRKAGLEAIELGPKEGLGMINGTQVSTALALAGLFGAWRLAQAALITGALASDALMASTAPFRSEVHLLRGQIGQIDAAQSLRSLLLGSEIRESHRKDDERVQDPYSLRCQPQVMGACIDIFRQAKQTLCIEANAVTDNPLVITDSGDILSGGNFHAEPVAFAADQCALAISEIGSITQRRIATLVDPTLNYGLPAFLSPSPGLNSGFMIAEVSAAALMAENKQKAGPCSIDSTPTSANQEDHVSMACHGAKRLLEMNQNLADIIGIELLAAAQGVEFRRPLKTSPALQEVITTLRSEVAPLTQDRFMANDLKLASNLINSGTISHSIDAELLPSLCT